MENQRDPPIYNYLKIVVGSILQILIVFSYFRKAHSEIESNAEFEIYNDPAGKLAMVHRILRLGCFLFCFFFQL